MKLLVLDCDSTLSGVEGVDELARMKGPEIFSEVAVLTNRAMNGDLPIQEVFLRRMDLIRPSQADCGRVAGLYSDHRPAGLEDFLADVRADGWTPVIVSGGFVPCIRPFADELGIEEVYGVPLFFEPDGTYAGYDETAPTSQMGGKRKIIEAMLRERHPVTSVMVGDGASDLEAKGLVDLCVGFGVFVQRPAVMAGADVFVRSLPELRAVLR